MDCAEALQRAMEFCGRVQSLELLNTVYGVKPGCRLKIARDELPLLTALATKLGLRWAIGYDRIDGIGVPGRGSFTEWCRRSGPKPGDKSNCFVYIAPAIRKAEQLRRADEDGDIERTGHLLGYPPCCIGHFAQSWSGSDPVLKSFYDRGRLSWYNNVSLLGFDWALLSHVPCNSRCEGSLEMAYRSYLTLFDGSPLIASELTLALANHVLHTEYLGVLAFKGSPEAGGWRVERIVLAHPDSPIRKIVGIGDKIGSSGIGIQIGDVLLADESARLLWFS